MEVGAALTGITNGRQLLAFDRFENWLLRAWLDDPVAVEVPGDALTVGREVELSVPVDDIVCTTREIVSDPTILPPGSPITFTLAEDPADTVRFRAPERISAADVIVDCG